MREKKPVIIVNFKTYKESTGRRALELARIHDTFAKNSKTDIMIAVQAADIYRVSQEVNIPVLAQHVDPVIPGKNTGSVLPESVKEAGASGTLLNHSEHRVSLDVLKQSILRCKDTGLKTIVCTPTIEEAKNIAKLNPDYLAFEEPSLIGTLKSVSRLKPEIVKRFAETIKKANPKIVPLCGAGIANGEDVRVSLELGTRGVLIATAVVKAKKPEKALSDLTEFC